ncbi:hypothetical protein ENSA5_04150 [Enhygromyxa salina]|uniref:Uncharacterized protein n=1 Tax=Enhygromyxa salina TaxID=215803 RepID=A0A2S9YJU1_9BACT|nr:hypothetical protein [Enhygromyxa salina]PRQ05296.1 hypothetical protein ENSA5_04150 [Enhygromyxa salina]
MDPHGIFSDLLTVEVNTIVKPNMTAAKMPSLPFALLDIIENFATALLKLGVDLEPYFTPTREQCWAKIRADPQHLEDARASYAAANGGGQPREESDLYDYLGDLWPALDPSLNSWPTTEGWSFSMAGVTNGWDSFERLRIAALAADPKLSAGHEVLITRIVGACSRLKYIVQGVQQFYAPAHAPRLSLGERLGQLLRGRDRRFASWPELLNKTRNDLLRRDQRQQRVPVHHLSPEDQSTVRKIWEVGTESVLAQTCVQLDGDVITRISEDLIEAHTAAVQELVLGCHHRSVDTGLSHWRALVQVAIELVDKVFGRISAR